MRVKVEVCGDFSPAKGFSLLRPEVGTFVDLYDGNFVDVQTIFCSTLSRQVLYLIQSSFSAFLHGRWCRWDWQIFAFLSF